MTEIKSLIDRETFDAVREDIIEGEVSLYDYLLTLTTLSGVYVENSKGKKLLQGLAYQVFNSHRFELYKERFVQKLTHKHGLYIITVF